MLPNAFCFRMYAAILALKGKVYLCVCGSKQKTYDSLRRHTRRSKCLQYRSPLRPTLPCTKPPVTGTEHTDNDDSNKHTDNTEHIYNADNSDLIYDTEHADNADSNEHAEHNEHATHYTLQTSCYTLPTTHYTLHATYYTLLVIP